MADARTALARQQAAIVGALVLGEQLPVEFDRMRLAACSVSLTLKRQRAVEITLTALSSWLGPALADHFASYAAGHPLPALGGAQADGREFARFLERDQRLPEAVAREIVAIDARFRTTAAGLVPRNFPACALICTAAGQRLLAAHCPRLGTLTLRLPALRLFAGGIHGR